MKYEEKIMGALAGFITKYRWFVLIAGVVLFLLSIIAAGQIEMKTELKDLLPEDNPQIQSYTEILDDCARCLHF